MFGGVWEHELSRLSVRVKVGALNGVAMARQTCMYLSVGGVLKKE